MTVSLSIQKIGPERLGHAALKIDGKLLLCYVLPVGGSLVKSTHTGKDIHLHIEAKLFRQRLQTVAPAYIGAYEAAGAFQTEPCIGARDSAAEAAAQIIVVFREKTDTGKEYLMKAAVPLHQPVQRLLASLAVHPGYQILFVPEMIVKGLQGQTTPLYDLLDRDAIKLLAVRKRQKRVAESFLGCAFFHWVSPFWSAVECNFTDCG